MHAMESSRCISSRCAMQVEEGSEENKNHDVRDFDNNPPVPSSSSSIVTARPAVAALPRRMFSM